MCAYTSGRINRGKDFDDVDKWCPDDPEGCLELNVTIDGGEKATGAW
jgi:hypothetical protein